MGPLRPCQHGPLQYSRTTRGIGAQFNPETGHRANVTLRGSLVDRNHEVGVAILGASLTLDDTVVRATQPDQSLGFGDGVALASSPTCPATGQLRASLIQDNARAGIASFGSAVAIEQVTLECNAIQLNGETDYALPGFPVSLPFSFDNLGGNLCSCNEQTSSCVVLSSGLAPPDALGGPTSP